jgi:hypothetical protein
MYKTIYCIFLSIGNNIIFNYYLFMFAMFPNYFKQSIINVKKNADNLYNSMMFLHFNDDLYKNYNINLMDIHANIMKMINENKMMIKDNDDEDNISIMSDLSDTSSLTDFFDE